MRIAIMQPTYLPWMGYFDLMDQVDAFVLLDDVEFSHRSWQQRNRIKGAQGLQWLTVPVRVKHRSKQRISEVEIVNPGFYRRHCKSFAVHYRKSSYFHEVSEFMQRLLGPSTPWHDLADMNESVTRALAARLGISTPIYKSSSLEAGGVRGQRVARLCEALSADEYLSPFGAEDYLQVDSAEFERRNIRVFLQHFVHPEYTQLYPPFVSHASIVDLLFNMGPDSLRVIRSGRAPASALDCHRRIASAS